MNLTKTRLKQIIKEEFEASMNERPRRKKAFTKRHLSEQEGLLPDDAGMPDVIRHAIILKIEDMSRQGEGFFNSGSIPQSVIRAIDNASSIVAAAVELAINQER